MLQELQDLVVMLLNYFQKAKVVVVMLLEQKI
jgi:hypothetical protein